MKLVSMARTAKGKKAKKTRGKDILSNFVIVDMPLERTDCRYGIRYTKRRGKVR